MTTLVWFRNDLRRADNPALNAALKNGPIIPLYILEDGKTGAPHDQLGGASRWWLHHSLTALKKSLGGLVVRQGAASDLVLKLASQFGVKAVVWNRCYEPFAIARDKDLKTALKAKGFAVESYNASLLVEPWEIATQSGRPYQVYSPFWRAVQKLPTTPPMRAAKIKLDQAVAADKGPTIDELDLLPKSPDWAAGLECAVAPR